MRDFILGMFCGAGFLGSLAYMWLMLPLWICR